MNRTNLLCIALLTGICCAPFAHAQILLSENFDATAIGGVPTGWSRSQPGATISGVTDAESVSPFNSYELTKNSGAAGGVNNSPSVSAPFSETITSGVVSLTLDVRVTSTSSDLLYVKMRNSISQEIGGVRLFNGTFGYVNELGGFTASAVTYSADTWYSLQIDFDLDAQTYTAWLDESTTIVEDTPFRLAVTTFDAANVLFQGNVNLTGTGESAYLDNVVVVPEPPIAAALMIGLLPLIAARLRKRRR